MQVEEESICIDLGRDGWRLIGTELAGLVQEKFYIGIGGQQRTRYEFTGASSVEGDYRGEFFMDKQVVFPISVKFEDGTMQAYKDVEDLETDLEVFDSDLATGCEVRDALGRPVRLKVGENLVLERLSLV